jgi:hypothetical protein
MSSWCLKGVQMFRGRAGGDLRALAQVCAILLGMLAPNAAIAQMPEQEIAKAFEEDRDLTNSNIYYDERCTDNTFEARMKMYISAKDLNSRFNSMTELERETKVLPICIFEQKQKHQRVDYASRSRMMGLLSAWHVFVRLEISKEPGHGFYANDLPIFIERAKLYLKYAADHNQRDAGEMLARLETEFSTKTFSGDTKPDFALSTEEAAGQLGSNTLAFEEKYQRKLLEIHGPVSHLSRATGRVSLFLLGASSKAKDELEDRHDIECQVTSPDELKKMTSLKKGMIVKVKGIYKSPGKGDTNAIPLTGCLIVSAKTPTPGVSDPLQ